MELTSTIAGWCARWSLPKILAAGFMAAGGLLLLAGLALPWMAVPVSAGDGAAVVRDATATPWWKTALLGGLVAIALVPLFSRSREAATRRAMRIGCLLVPLVLAFPQAVIVYDARTSGDLAWLQQQHDSLTWLGGDVFLAHGLRQQQVTPVIDMADPPLRLAAFRPPTIAPWSLGIAEVPDLVWWMGYNPAFCQFVARGWVATVLGLAFALTGWLGWRRRDDEKGGRRGDFRICAGTLAAGMIVWAGIALVPVVAAGHWLKLSRAAALDDDPQRGREALARACAWMPALAFDTGVILQHGRFDLACGDAATHRARLRRVLSLEEDGYDVRARAALEELAGEAPGDRAVTRELSRMLLRAAVNDFNSGRLADGRRRLEMVCRREPAALQARFHLQLVALQGGDLGLNRQCRAEVEALYKPFQRKEKKGVMAASWLMLAQGEIAAGNIAEAAQAREKSRKL